LHSPWSRRRPLSIPPPKNKTKSQNPSTNRADSKRARNTHETLKKRRHCALATATQLGLGFSYSAGVDNRVRLWFVVWLCTGDHTVPPWVMDSVLLMDENVM
jgi:hypothetical protein